MRRSTVSLTVITVLCGACSRDLGLPSSHQVSIAPGFSAVAPREALTLVAEGGAGGYRFAFAEGGKLSGDDAAVDALTGDYVAGARGAALDVVVVTDRSGATASARISVGAPLALSPALAATAPRGTVTFTATGGRPPYAFAFEGRPGSGSTVDPDTGIYVAGPDSGDASEVVVVSDATGDAAATARAEVRVGRALSIFPSLAQAVAPRERLQFVGLGGEPSYTFTVSSATGATIDGAGTYLAGAAGSSEDLVTVEDALGATASVRIAVGPALAVALSGGDTRPTVASQLAATGGKVPYTFRYAAKGNRTRGRVAGTGEYVPGPIVGAHDVVEVEDAVGTVARATLPALGPWQAHLPAPGAQALAADVDGDQRQDAIFATGNAVHGWRLGASGAATEITWRFGNLSGLVPMELSGDWKTDFLTFSPAATILSDPSGNLQWGIDFPWGGSPRGSAFVTPGGYVRVVTDAPCTMPDLTTPGITWATLWPQRSPFLGSFCEPVARDAGWVEALAAGMLGNSVEGVAWVTDGEEAIRISIRDGMTALLGPAKIVPFPDGWSKFSGGAYVLSLAVLPPDYGRGSVQDLVVTLADASGRVSPWLLRDLAFVGPLDPDPAGPGLVGVAARTTGSGDMLLVGWTGLDGNVYAWDVPAGALPGEPRVAAVLPFPVGSAALPDVNGDGIADLVGAPVAGPTADILLGDGVGFGGRVHFGGFELASFADVDGDGLDDVVAATASPGLRVHFGGDHELAWGPETSIPSGAAAIVVGRFGAGAGVVWQDALGAVRIASLAADGTMGAPVTLTVANAASMRPLPPDMAPTWAAHGADLGTASPGEDIWWRTNDAAGERWNGLLLDGPAHATYVWAESPGTWCHFGVAGSPAGGDTAVAAACLDDGGDGSTRVSAWRAPVDAAGPGAWTLVGATEWLPDTNGRRVQWEGGAGGVAAFLAQTSDVSTGETALRLVLVPGGGAPTIELLPPSATGLPTSLSSGAWADVTGDGLPDVVTQSYVAGTIVEIRPGLPGGGFGPTWNPIPAAGFLVGARRLVPGQSDPVLMIGTELVPFPVAP
jgi:hypothetical protein